MAGEKLWWEDSHLVEDIEILGKRITTGRYCSIVLVENAVVEVAQLLSRGTLHIDGN